MKVAAPVHAAGLAGGLRGGMEPTLPNWAFAGVPVGLGLTVLATWLPLRAGGRSLEATEF